MKNHLGQLMLVSALSSVALAQPGELNIYFGNLHAHTSFSDGDPSTFPAKAFQFAKEQGKLDFLAITEHNHSKAESGERADGVLIAKNHKLYEKASDPKSLIGAARAATEDGVFVALYGQEFSTISSGNHVNVFDVDRVIDELEVPSGDYRAFFDNWLRAHLDSTGQPAVVELNHPDIKSDLAAGTIPKERRNDYGFDDYQQDFQKLAGATSENVRLIEIMSGPALSSGGPTEKYGHHEWDYFFYLNKGFRLAPTANQDNHYLTYGTITRARTAILAPELTKASLLNALRNRRCYATEDQNLKLDFRLDGHPMGSVLKRQGGPVRFTVKLTDADEPDANYKVQLLHDVVGGEEAAQVAATEQRTGDGAVEFNTSRTPGTEEYWFLRVQQSGPPVDKVWTAPIWVTP